MLKMIWIDKTSIFFRYIIPSYFFHFIGNILSDYLLNLIFIVSVSHYIFSLKYFLRVFTSFCNNILFQNISNIYQTRCGFNICLAFAFSEKVNIQILKGSLTVSLVMYISLGQVTQTLIQKNFVETVLFHISNLTLRVYENKVIFFGGWGEHFHAAKTLDLNSV